jgi:hypothetical protein
MKPDPKPQLGPAGIEANIAHYEALVQNSHEDWQKHITQLQFWLDELQRTSDSVAL